jgi:hypothetical protein
VVAIFISHVRKTGTALYSENYIFILSSKAEESHEPM